MNKDLLCDSSNSLIEVMRIINKNGKGVCFVIDESKSLKGVVTDGDIRRALLDSIHLDEKVENILSKDFCYGNIDEHYDSLIVVDTKLALPSWWLRSDRCFADKNKGTWISH